MSGRHSLHTEGLCRRIIRCHMDIRSSVQGRRMALAMGECAGYIGVREGTGPTAIPHFDRAPTAQPMKVRACRNPLAGRRGIARRDGGPRVPSSPLPVFPISSLLLRCRPPEDITARRVCFALRICALHTLQSFACRLRQPLPLVSASPPPFQERDRGRVLHVQRFAQQPERTGGSRKDLF